jgi:hypothetical protein
MKHLGLQKLLSSQVKHLIVQEKLLTVTASVLEKFGLHAGIEELCLEFSSSRAVEI